MGGLVVAEAQAQAFRVYHADGHVSEVKARNRGAAKRRAFALHPVPAFAAYPAYAPDH